ncbi:DUF805 domain-containing protein [Paeniglutamicibacter sp. NPDC091659]|uniref:DUF805 domain-containing protein n=1 Tax=Paeniglutamicibacter sp. NPDC091659 TaxID=3364389 RepID=UPI003806BAEE
MSDSTVAGDHVPLSAPYYGASLPTAFKRFWQKCATFSGRASRSDFWWWELVGAIVGLILYSICIPSLLTALSERSRGAGFHLNGGMILFIVLASIWGLATIVPSLALAWRRLHDANFSGWFFLLALIPGIGGIILRCFALVPSNPLGVRFDKPETPGPGAT